MYDVQAKGLFFKKKKKKNHGISAQKLSCINKSMKNGNQMKNFQSM